MIDQQGGYWALVVPICPICLPLKRNNAKTQEATRLTYYKFDGNAANNNKV
ncbi:MAG: hypothetical protein IPI77_18050 [Saprospiraceae bacterium]|nr:hypothetical protein [Saprospiraceae bacterium]